MIIYNIEYTSYFFAFAFAFTFLLSSHTSTNYLSNDFLMANACQMFVIFISGRRLVPFIMRLRFLAKQIEDISLDYALNQKKKLLIPMNHDGWLYFLFLFLFFFSATKAR